MFYVGIRHFRNLTRNVKDFLKIQAARKSDDSDLANEKKSKNFEKLNELVTDSVSVAVFTDACKTFGPMVGKDPDVSKKMLKEIVANSADRKYQTEEWKRKVDACIEDFRPREDLYKESFVTYLQPFVDGFSEKQLEKAHFATLLIVLARSSPSDTERVLAWKVKEARNRVYRFPLPYGMYLSDEAYEWHSTNCNQLIEILDQKPWPENLNLTLRSLNLTLRSP